MNTNGKGINLEETNGMWKGINVGYGALHEWVTNRLKKPFVCSKCNQNKIVELSNISGEYKRDLSDWEWLCRKCHMAQDGRAKSLRFIGKHTEESKAKISETTKKYFRDEEWKNWWVETMKGKKRTERFKTFISEFATKRERDKFGRFI
jgi:hypothetical protein